MKQWLVALLLLPFFAQAQDADSAWIVNNYTKQEVYIPMRDGVKLFTAIYTPKDASEKHPILINRTPYTSSPYGVDKFRAFWNNHYKHYLKEGYIMVIQDVRGRWMSEGEFVDVRPYNPDKKGNEVDEASDTYDTIDWLIKNIANNNGRVGAFGISYPGFYTTMSAMSNHPALKAVSPQAPVTDWFIGDDFHHNGAFMLMDGFSFYWNFGRPRPKPITQQTPGTNIFTSKDNYNFYLKIGALSNFTKLTGDSIAFWKDLMAHPNYDAWWQARNARKHVDKLQTPAVLVVGGLFDAEDCFGAWELYKAIEAKSKTDNRIVMGPWYHGQWARGDGSRLGNVQFGSNTSEWYAQNMEIPFFNYHLKNKGSLDKIAEANIFFTGSNKWWQFPKWPMSTATTPLYLQANGKADFKASKEQSSSTYISDPSKPVPYTEDVHFSRTREYMTDDQRFASRRTDVLTFETDVLNEDVTVAGTLVADLLVSLSSTDADFVVKLIDVFPDDFKYADESAQASRTAPSKVPMGGYQMLVRGEVMRGRYRNSFEKPEAFTPNKPTTVKFNLPDVAHTFQKGHRIMVQIQSSWFPLVDRNPQQFINIYTAKDSDFQKATIRVYHNQSKIHLPILK